MKLKLCKNLKLIKIRNMKCITFDLTNTLIKVSGNIGSIYANIAKKHGYELDNKLAVVNFRKQFKNLNNLYPGYGFSIGLLVKNLIKEDALAKNIQPPSETHAARIGLATYEEFKQAKYWAKYENADLVLDKLKQNGYKLGVISNFDERIFNIIKNLNLSNFFDFVLIPSTANGFYKPKREIFLQAQAKANVKSSNMMLHVGDDIDLDYLAAVNCDFKSILLIHDSAGSSNANKIQLIQEKNYVYANNLNDLYDKILNKF